MVKKTILRKVLSMFLLFWLIDLLQGYSTGFLRGVLINNDANGLIVPVTMLIQFGIILPILLGITKIKTRELGLNVKNIKYGFLLSLKYFLWIIILGCAAAFIQAYPSYKTFEPHHWRVLRFVDEGWSHFMGILISPVLWQEIISRGLFFVYLVKLGFDKQFNVKFLKVNQAVFITALFFSLIHLKNFLGIGSLGGIIYALVYILGAILVGYMLGLIRKKTDSLFWPIMLHTIANFGEWFVKIMIPIILVNQI